MQNVLILVALVALAYVIAHWGVERLQRRFLLTGGAEYVLIGVLLGPAVPGTAVLDQQALADLAPVVSLAIGWIGLTYGMQANLRTLLDSRDGSVSLSLTEWAVCLGTVALVAHAVLDRGWIDPLLSGPVGPDDHEIATWVLAASATVGSATALRVVMDRYVVRGDLAPLLDRATRFGELLAIVAFGLTTCVYHATTPGPAETWDWGNWIVISVGLGVGLGLLFRLFLGDEHDEGKQFLALLGIIVFAGGAAWYLELSTLLVNLILGAVLANVSPDPDEIVEVLERFHRPMVIVLLIFAGAWLTRQPLAVGLVLAAYMVVRLGAKLVGGWIGSRSLPISTRSDLGRGLLGHGEVATAMALTYRQTHGGPLAELVFVVIVGSVILTDLWAARSVRSLLVDAGDLQGPRKRGAQPVTIVAKGT